MGKGENLLKKCIIINSLNGKFCEVSIFSKTIIEKDKPNIWLLRDYAEELYRKYFNEKYKIITYEEYWRMRDANKY